MSKLVRGVGKVVKKVFNGVKKVVKKIWKNPITRAIVIAVAIYFAAPVVAGWLSGATASAEAAGFAAGGGGGAGAFGVSAADAGSAAAFGGAAEGAAAAAAPALIEGAAANAVPEVVASAAPAATAPSSGIITSALPEAAIHAGTGDVVSTVAGNAAQSVTAPQGWFAKLMSGAASSPYTGPAMVMAGGQVMSAVGQGIQQNSMLNRQEELRQEELARYNRNMNVSGIVLPVVYPQYQKFTSTGG